MSAPGSGSTPPSRNHRAREQSRATPRGSRGTGARALKEAGPSATTTTRQSDSRRRAIGSSAPSPTNDLGNPIPARSRNHHPRSAASGTSAPVNSGAPTRPTPTAVPHLPSEERKSPTARPPGSAPATTTRDTPSAATLRNADAASTSSTVSAAAVPDSSGTRIGAPGTSTTGVLTPRTLLTSPETLPAQ